MWLTETVFTWKLYFCVSKNQISNRNAKVQLSPPPFNYFFFQRNAIEIVFPFDVYRLPLEHSYNFETWNKTTLNYEVGGAPFNTDLNFTDDGLQWNSD